MNYDVNIKDNDTVMLLMDGARALVHDSGKEFREARNDGESSEETLNYHEYTHLKAKAMLKSLSYTFARNRAVEAKRYTPDTPVGRADLAVYAADTAKAKAEYAFAVLIADEAMAAWRESYSHKYK
jgi:hypothetical protein